jgi:hypothetical protein
MPLCVVDILEVVDVDEKQVLLPGPAVAARSERRRQSLC